MKLLNKLSKSGSKLFKNAIQSKVLLYFLAVVSILNVLFFGYLKDYASVFSFIIIALLMSFFSKNMIVILLVAIVLSNLIKFTIKVSYEGLENMEDEKDEEDDNDIEGTIEKTLNRIADEEIQEQKNEEQVAIDKAKEEEKQALYSDLKNDMIEFEELQKNIMSNMKEIDPLLTKAENFVEKFEGYKKKLN